MANAQVNLKYIANTKGGQNLVLDGFKFRVKSRRNNITYWEFCMKTRACAARVTIRDGMLASPIPQHNHPSEESKIAVQEVVEQMKARVKTVCKYVHALYKEELRAYSSREGIDMASTIPTFSSVQASLYRSRATNTPLLPRRPSEINLPPAYTLTSSQQQFLLAQQEKMIIFATTDNLYHLSRADTYFCDGTFHISPGLFYQFYTIHGFVNGKMCPLVYGLLPDKKQSTYLAFFNTIKEKAAENNIILAPTTIFTDFEAAAQNAARAAFTCDLKGCLFHFRQAVWRNVQKNGLQTLFNTDPSVNLLIKRACALVLVRPCDIDDSWFHALEEAETDDPRINRFADYVTEQWINGNREIWNHFDTVGPRTTNHLKGWHSKLKKQGPGHPNIYKFLDLIKAEQDDVEVIIKQLENGGRLAPKRRKYRRIDERILELKNLLTTGAKTLVEYLNAVLHFV